MIKVLIADDEERDRHIVRLLLERQYKGIFFILETKNGEETLEKLKAETPDLVLLDINMPGMNGFEVLRGQTEIPYVIILTAYSNFEYTREALRLGVRDYLLKPPVRAEFYKAIEQFLNDFKVEKERSGKVQYREVFTRDLAQQLFYLGNMKKIRGLLDVLEIRKRQGICGILTYNETEVPDPALLLDAAEEYLDEAGSGYAATFCTSGIAVVLFCNNEEETQETLALIGRLANSLESDFCISLEVRMGFPAEMPDGFPRAFQTIQNLDRTHTGMPVWTSEDMNALQRAISCSDFRTAMAVLDSLIRQLQSGTAVNLIKYQLMSALNQCVVQLEPADNSKFIQSVVSIISAADDPDEIRDQTAQLVHFLVSRSEGKKADRNDAVAQICEEVQKDCSRHWSIDEFSRILHISPYHLSHLFKKHTGCCFTDYLTQVRIEQALSLMKSTNLSLTQISDSVGYLDPNYFSRVFKKMKGVSPREYCRNLRDK